ncbi:hypothetical protein HO173_007545 [Letharia columbiana]|uniref:Uncharacterized protein n=1 Tax=Letharia columbiana TaxID=112416 RepID=A0A8H6FT30_9LECA|nr:uncharacterized protein HO173_007545 [Letharia columbiana]KAF6234126.1 hypothetical protein HO173_007545 [Letharia columbiana]
MAITGPTTSMSSFFSKLLSSLLILLATQPCSLNAQPQQSPTSTTSSSAIPSLVNNPANGDTAPSSFTPSSLSSAIPSATDSAGYGSQDNNTTSSPHNGILNYYFLLLAVFVVAILVIYWSLARRRRKAAAQLSRMQQRVLSEDVRSWTRHRQPGQGLEDEERGGTGRDEGLDEAGEAPPAYVKEPERAHLDRGEGVELRGMARFREMVGLEGKPPDYEEGLPSR